MNFEQENDDYLEKLLSITFLDAWKTPPALDNIDAFQQKSLQINVTYLCNQKCEYCYVIKHGKELYPREFDKKEIVLHNLEILLQWCAEKYPYIPKLEIFSGEIWHSIYGIEVLECVYRYLDRVFFHSVVIPSNMSFILDTEQTIKVQELIDRFSEKGCNIQFSASVDGLLVEDLTRPLSKGELGLRDESFYDNLFKFLKHNGYSAHPMLCAYAIEHWKMNYLWWYDQCSKYGFSFLSFMMLLEVRNNDWTAEKIAKYEEFQEFQFDFILNKVFDGDKKLMSDYVVGLIKGDVAYQGLLWGRNQDTMSCSICRIIAVRLGDLTICPCHRTSYPQFNYGKFVVKEDKIIGIQAKNVQLATHILCGNMKKVIMGCDVCIYKNVCLRQCFGANYESNSDILMPIMEVCEFFKHKYNNLLDLMFKNGLIDIFMNSDQPMERKEMFWQDIKQIQEWRKINEQGV